MRVLLTTLNAKYIHINLAIRQLYALYHEQYPSLEWKEFTIKEETDAIADYCQNFEIIAFSCYIWNITPTLKVAKAIKALNPNCKILLGGPEVSYEWQEIIIQEAIDYIIIGEGEIPFGKFLESYPNTDQVPSLVSKNINGAIHYNSKQENVEVAIYKDIRPYSFDEPSTLLNRVAYIETSRGCPYKCEFCLASLDNKVRYLPDEHIKATLLHLMQHGKVIKFLDRTFNIKKDFTISMFEFILKHHQPGNVFQFEITADIVHPDIIKFIDEKVPKGLFRFEIGIQTVNQKANLEVSRKQNFEKTTGIIKQLEHKIEMHLDLIVGLPLDEWEDIKYSFEEVFKLFAPELQLGFLKFLKGTPLREKSAQHGFEYDPMPPYEIIRSNFLTEHQLADIRLVEHCLEIYWNKPRATNTLRHVATVYSVFDFFLGLGRSISACQEFYTLRLDQLYTYLYQYVVTHFPNDLALRELVVIDYFLQHKIKPKRLFEEELENKAVNIFLQDNHFDHTRYRYRALQLHFDFEIFQSSQKIIPASKIFLVQYSGIKKPNYFVIECAIEV